MPHIENSEVVKHVLNTLINMSGRKTNTEYAVSTMNNLIKNLKMKYSFLKNVDIKDTRFLELSEPVTVMSDIDKINSADIGKALYDIIKTMNVALGKNAGYFFIKEFRNNVGDNYYSVMQEMGIDLGLLQLEFEVSEMTKKL